MSHFVLETITPIHIGNGNTLSPYGDYIYDRNTNSIYLIDQQKLFDAINEYGDSVMDGYVKMVGANTQQNHYTLKKLLDEYKIDVSSVSKVRIPAKSPLKSEQIFETIKSGARPYIPGSSLKGAIRTALLYTHRKEDGYTINEALVDSGRRRSDTRKPSPNGEDLFGSFGKDIFKYLHLSDSELLPVDDIEIVKTVTFNLVKASTDIPIIKEAIPPGRKVHFRMQSKAMRGYHKIPERFSYFYQSDNGQGEREILQKVNEFTLALLEKELKTLNNHHSSEMAPILQLYKRLLGECKQFKEKQNGALMRIGSGKTFFDNTISILLPDQELEKLPLKRKGKGLFPRTRKVTVNQELFNSVLGWVKINPLQE